MSGILSHVEFLKVGGLAQATPWSPLYSSPSFTSHINIVTSTFVRREDKYIHLHCHHPGSNPISSYLGYCNGFQTGFLASSLGVSSQCCCGDIVRSYCFSIVSHLNGSKRQSPSRDSQDLQDQLSALLPPQLCLLCSCPSTLAFSLFLEHTGSQAATTGPLHMTCFLRRCTLFHFLLYFIHTTLSMTSSRSEI